jgi:hypothetical protein
MEASATLGGGGGSISLKTWVLGEAGHAPFKLYPSICLTTEENHGKPQLR